MITIWLWLKFYFGNSVPKQSVTSDIKKRLFNDFQCHGKVLSTDMYNQKTKPISRSGVVGVPDLIMIVKDKGKKYLLVGERKGRNYKGVVRQYELNQVLLYMFIIKSLQPYPVIGRLAFNNQCIDINYDSLQIMNILSKKRECMLFLDSLNKR